MATFELDFLRKEDIKWAKQKADDSFDFTELVKNKVIGAGIELADGMIVEQFLKIINAKVKTIVPDDVKKELHEVFDLVLIGDYKQALLELDDVVSVILDNADIDPKFDPWINILFNIYEGLILELV